MSERRDTWNDPEPRFDLWGDVDPASDPEEYERVTGHAFPYPDDRPPSKPRYVTDHEDGTIWPVTTEGWD